MKYRKLGKWGVKVSELGLGSWLTLGHHVDDDTGRVIFRKAHEAGINFIDTSNVYNCGGSETALGHYIKEVDRSSVVVATKCFSPMGDGPNDRGLSRKHVMEQCHASLKRLQTDYIDVYQCHGFDPNTPLEETIRTFHYLQQQGKILYWGTSKWPAEQIRNAIEICKRWGFDPPASNQPRYNLLFRSSEKYVFPLCELEGIGQVTFSPLAHGVLSGKYKPGEQPPVDSRAADDKKNMVMMKMYYDDEKLKRVEEMKKIADELGCNCGQLAIAWIRANTAVSSVILGVTKEAQLEDNLKGLEVDVTPEIKQKLERLFPMPAELVPEG